MLSNRSSRLWILTIGCIILVTAVTFSLRKSSQRSGLISRVDALENQIVASHLSSESITSLESKILKRQDEIIQLEASRNYRSAANKTDIGPKSEKVEESILDAWLDRTDRLSRYLQQNESFKIPELKYLTPMDWLDVTKFKTIETEADYRAASAMLRRAAKRHVIPKIQASLKAYLKKSGDQLPESVTELLAYSDGAFDQEIIARYQMNPSGLMEGMLTNIDIIITEKDAPVDRIWNTRAGLAGTMISSTPGGPDRLLERTKNAFTNFETEHQRPPNNSKDLESYFSKEFIEILPELFQAATTRITLDP